jgi:hypothetical protein
MTTPTEAQILATIESFKREVAENGLTEAADQMWLHALRLKQVRDREPAVVLRMFK